MNHQPQQYVEPKKAPRKEWLPFLVAAGIICFISFSVLSLVHFTNLDNAIFKITLNGRITDESGNAISEAEISLDNVEVAYSDENGYYEFTGLEPKTAEITVNKENFLKVEEQIEINNAFLNYEIRKDFTLRQSVLSTVKGSFVKPNDNYDFLRDTLEIGDVRITIRTDGSFESAAVPTGTQTFSFKSPNFKDITQEITIEATENNINPITPVPAGDIVSKFVTYIAERPIDDYRIQVQNVPDRQIEVDSQDNLRIRDLEIGQTYSIRISGSKIETRDYTVTVKQGENQLPSDNHVETGSVAYLYQIAGERGFSLVKSDFDGEDLEQLTQVQSGATAINPTSPYYNESDDSVYFLTAKDRIRGRLENSIKIVYKASNGQMNQVTTVTNNLDRVFAFYRAESLVSITSEARNANVQRLYITNLTGANPQLARTINAKDFTRVLLPVQKNTIVTLETDRTRDKGQELVVTRLSDGQATVIEAGFSINLHSISDDGNRIIYTAIDPRTSLPNLILYDVNQASKQTLIQDAQGGGYQFLHNSSSKIVYVDRINNRSGIYEFDTQNSRNTRLFELSTNAQDAITNLYQQNNYFFYTTRIGLYVFDINFPRSYKLVAQGEANML